ncbi:MAG: signal recognition particle subunit SRP19/SEC65 family protein [Candidatus Kariarchaeaceae archaeon]
MSILLRRKKFYVIYPEYFDSTISRSQGRRVPLSLADPDPHLKKITKACERLEIEFQPEPEKAHPTFWWKKSGRILIPIDKNNKTPKEELIKEIAKVSRKFHLKKKSKTVKIKKDSKSQDEKKSGKSKYKTARNISAKRRTKKK